MRSRREPCLLLALMRRLLAIGLMVLVAGCCTRKKVDEKEDGAGGVASGRLRFGKGHDSLRIGSTYLWRDITQNFYVSGKKWLPPGDPKLADRINWCATPVPEVLECYGDITDHYAATYLITMKGDQPALTKVDEPAGSYWVDKTWLLFHAFFLNVETGERVPVKGLECATKDCWSIANHALGVSPDRRHLALGFVRDYDGKVIPELDPAKRYFAINLYDLVSGSRVIGFAALDEYPWLESPSTRAQHELWSKTASGYALTVTHLIVLQPPAKKQ